MNAKVRGILGSLLTIVFGVLSLSMMALPMLKVGEHDLASVFDSLELVSQKGVTGDLKTSLVFFILLIIAASILIILGIVALVSALLGNKKLNVTIYIRALAIVLIAFAFVALLCAAVYANSMTNELISYSIAAGTILPFCFAIVPVIAAFILPTKKKA